MTTTSIFVKLTSSKNTYISYPAFGLLEILEFGTTGSIIVARFRKETDGKLGAAVEVRDAEFEYSKDIARQGHAAVADLKSRQLAGDSHRECEHELYDLDTGSMLGKFPSRLLLEIHCQTQNLRVSSYRTDSRSSVVRAEVYPTLGTAILAKIYAIACSNSNLSEVELTDKFLALEISARAAREHARIVKSVMKL